MTIYALCMYNEVDLATATAMMNGLLCDLVMQIQPATNQEQN